MKEKNFAYPSLHALQLLIVAVVLSCLCRNPIDEEDYDDNEEQLELGADEEYHFMAGNSGGRLYALTDVPGMCPVWL